MTSMVLLCLASLLRADCQIGSAVAARYYELDAARGLFMCQSETMQRLAADQQMAEMLKTGKYVAKVFCTMGRVKEAEGHERG